MHILQTILSKETYIAFKINILFHSIPGNWTHDLAIANAMLFCLLQECPVWNNINVTYNSKQKDNQTIIKTWLQRFKNFQYAC